MSNPYAHLSVADLQRKIDETLDSLQSAGIDEAALDAMILAERRKLDPYAPQTRAEFEREWARKEDMKWYERIGDGLAQTPEMFKYVFGTLGGAIVDQMQFGTDPVRGLKSIAEGGARGTRDLWEMVKGIKGELGDWGHSRQVHMDREYDRYLKSLEYQRARDGGLLFDQDEIFEDYAELGSLILDPSNLIPFGAVGKAGSKAARKGVKVAAKGGAKLAGGARRMGEVVADKASLPRKKFADFLNDVARMHPTSAEGASVAGTLAAAVTSIPVVSPVGKTLLGAEALGIGAKVGGEMAEGVLNALASDNVAKRFLTRIAESPDVPMLARRMANFARKNGGQWALDKAYNMILASVEVGAINGALQWAATGDPEGFGAGVAQGIAMSPIVGLAMPNGAGLSAQARLDWATQNFMDKNGAHLEQLDLGFSREVMEEFAKTPEGRKSLEVLGALDGLAPELNLSKLVHFLDEETYNQIADNPNTDGEYNPTTREILIKTKKGTANTVASSGLHEVGHYILSNILETNTAAREFLINEVTQGGKVETKGIPYLEADAPTRDGVHLPTRSNDPHSLRELTPQAAEFKKRYEYRVDEDGNILTDEDGNPIRRGPEIRDLETLVQEMGAETIGELLYGTSPTGLLGLNNHALRGAALSAVSALFSKLMPWRDTSGTPAPGGFARLDPNFQGLPILRDLFNNYRNVRQKHLDWRTKLEEMDGVIKGKDGKTARELIVNIAPDTQLFDPQDLEAMDGKHGKGLRQAHKAEPPAGNEATVGPRVKGDRSSGIGERLSAATKQFFSNILSKGAMALIDELEAAISTRNVIGGWYSKRADKRGNNELTYRETVPYGIGISNQGNLLLYGWNLNKLHDAIILAEELGLVEGRTLEDGTKISAADVLRQRISEASMRQARGERIADELVAALFGARYARDTQIKDTRHIEFARELNRRRAHPSQTMRIDTMQGFRRLEKDGFMFNWVDISNNNRPNRPARAEGRPAAARAVADALAMPERPDAMASAERDAAYMDAVERGDMDKAQELVDQAAKAAGLVRSAHATGVKFTEFNREKIPDFDPDTNVKGFHFSNKADVTSSYRYQDSSKNHVMDVYLDLGRTIDRRSAQKMVAEGKHEDSFPVGFDTVVFRKSAGKPTKQQESDYAAGKRVDIPNTPYYVIKGEKDFVFVGGSLPETVVSADLYYRDNPQEGVITGYLDLADAFSMHQEEHYVLRSPNQIKSADPITRDNNGNVIPLSERFDKDSTDIRYSAERDAAYMDAVERGDMDKAQELVAQAAKAAGYGPEILWHGTNSDTFTTFETGRAGYMYFTPNKEYAQSYGENMLGVYLKYTKLADLTNPKSEAYKEAVRLFNEKGGWSENPDAMEGRDSSDFNPNTDDTWEIFDNPDTDIQFEMSQYDAWKLWENEKEGIVSYAVTNSDQVKLADPVTRDADGNVIPLSERFDKDSTDIRYSADRANWGVTKPEGFGPDSHYSPDRRNDDVVRSAIAYARQAGIDYNPHIEQVRPPRALLEDYARLLEEAQHAPNDPQVLRAYDALKEELYRQYEHMLNDITPEAWEQDGQPYANSAEMLDDVARNKHLYFFLTEQGFGEGGGDAVQHPLLAESPYKLGDRTLLANDVLRVVHDYYGHAGGGFQFGPVGEFNAYLSHAAMFSDAARPALAAETMLQNAWFNYGPHINPDAKPGDPDYIHPADRPYSEQKAFVAPATELDRASLASPPRTRSKAQKQGSKEASIGVAALRKQVLPSLGYASRKARETHFRRFMEENRRIAEALGITIEVDNSTIGGWKEDSDISRENSQRLIIRYDKEQDLRTFTALLGSLAPEVQDAVMSFQYKAGGLNREYTIKIDPARAEELTSLSHLEKFGLEDGFTYDPKNNEIIFATWDKDGEANVFKFIDNLDQQGAGGSYSFREGKVNFPGEAGYRQLLTPARLRKHYQGKSWNRLHSLADEARRKLAHKPRRRADQNFKKGRRGRARKVKLKDQGRVIAEHDALVVQSSTIYPQGTKVIGDLTKQQSLGWNQFKEANAYADEIQASLPDAGINSEQWGEIMALRTQNNKSRVVARLPETLAGWIRDPENFRAWWREHTDKEPLYLESAIEGLGAVLENHKIAKQGGIPVEMTAAHMLWAVASIAAGPFAQEAGWIALVNQPRTWELVFDSIDGNYNLKEEQWRQHIDTFSRGGVMADVYSARGGYKGKTPYPGNSVTSNLNSMHKMLEMWNGRWHQLNDIINNPALSGPQMRDEFFSQDYGGAYLGPKILSFVLATLARDDMVIVDRWQLINLWKKYLDDKVGGDPFRYERDGTPVDTTNFYDTYVPLLSGTQGLGVFKALESGLDVLIDQNYDFLKDELAPVPPSRFALHWAMWDMIKGEAVGHSSLDATQKFLLQNKFPTTQGDRARFVEDFTNEPKSTQEFYRTEDGPAFRELEVRPGGPGAIRPVAR